MFGGTFNINQHAAMYHPNQHATSPSPTNPSQSGGSKLRQLGIEIPAEKIPLVNQLLDQEFNQNKGIVAKAAQPNSGPCWEQSGSFFEKCWEQCRIANVQNWEQARITKQRDVEILNDNLMKLSFEKLSWKIPTNIGDEQAKKKARVEGHSKFSIPILFHV